MAERRARPSLLLPAWRAVGYAVGTGSTIVLPVDALGKVQDTLASAVAEHYDDNIRHMYEAKIDGKEGEVRTAGRQAGVSGAGMSVSLCGPACLVGGVGGWGGIRREACCTRSAREIRATRFSFPRCVLPGQSLVPARSTGS